MPGASRTPVSSSTSRYAPGLGVLPRLEVAAGQAPAVRVDRGVLVALLQEDAALGVDQDARSRRRGGSRAPEPLDVRRVADDAREPVDEVAAPRQRVDRARVDEHDLPPLVADHVVVGEVGEGQVTGRRRGPRRSRRSSSSEESTWVRSTPVTSVSSASSRSAASASRLTRPRHHRRPATTGRGRPGRASSRSWSSSQPRASTRTTAAMTAAHPVILTGSSGRPEPDRHRMPAERAAERGPGAARARGPVPWRRPARP